MGRSCARVQLHGGGSSRSEFWGGRGGVGLGW